MNAIQIDEIAKSLGIDSKVVGETYVKLSDDYFMRPGSSWVYTGFGGEPYQWRIYKRMIWENSANSTFTNTHTVIDVDDEFDLQEWLIDNIEPCPSRSLPEVTHTPRKKKVRRVDDRLHIMHILVAIFFTVIFIKYCLRIF